MYGPAGPGRAGLFLRGKQKGKPFGYDDPSARRTDNGGRGGTCRRKTWVLWRVAQERYNVAEKNKILVITNHSYMLWQFRKELIAELVKGNEVVLSMPFVGHEEDFQAMGIRCIDTRMERRGSNPLSDLRLMRLYRKILRQEAPDLVITYSIKPNIYAGLLCGMMGIPFCANVQGLGTAFQRRGLAELVTLLYRLSFRKVKTVFFENQVNAAEFRRRHIVSGEKQVVLRGAGINLEYYALQPYPRNEKVHFLYLGRIM